LTWGLTSFLGFYALFGGSTALILFWAATQLGMFGNLVLNWLGMAWAQYERDRMGVTAFTDSDNLIAMGINLTYNMLSFVIYLGLQGTLCSISQF